VALALNLLEELDQLRSQLHLINTANAATTAASKD
jgi:hypothetical protein